MFKCIECTYKERLGTTQPCCDCVKGSKFVKAREDDRCCTNCRYKSRPKKQGGRIKVSPCYECVNKSMWEYYRED